MIHSFQVKKKVHESKVKGGKRKEDVLSGKFPGSLMKILLGKKFLRSQIIVSVSALLQQIYVKLYIFQGLKKIKKIIIFKDSEYFYV